MYDGDKFEHEGATFTVSIERDDCGDTPWERAEGHGVVGDWQRRETTTEPRGYWRLSCERHYERLYNWFETMTIAKRDGWGLCEEHKAKLAKRLGRTPTARDIRKEAVRRDYEFLRGWCDDEWQYVVIGVTLDGTHETQYLGGVESNCEDYIAECARDLASELLYPYNQEKDRAIAELGG
jgi:hypothetical protein